MSLSNEHFAAPQDNPPVQKRSLWDLLYFVLVVWMFGAYFLQDGGTGFIRTVWPYIIGSILLTRLLLQPLSAAFGWGFSLAISFVVIYLYTVGSSSYPRDTVVAIFALIVAGVIARARKGFSPSLFLLLTWLFLTFSDVFFGPSTQPRDPGRFREILSRASWKSARVGLALSGGGFRAALMHAGVLSALDDAAIPVRAISAVSGGAIIGSYYAAGGPPEKFLVAVQSRSFNLARELTHFQNTLRLAILGHIPVLGVKVLPGPEFSRVDVQAGLIDHVLLGGKRFADIEGDGAPKLMFGVTDLMSGRLVGLLKGGVISRYMAADSTWVPIAGWDMYREPRCDPSGKSPGTCTLSQGLIRAIDDTVNEIYKVDLAAEERQHYPRDTHLADLAATSGAFPLAFNTVWYQSMDDDERGHRGLNLLLADGGIMDNSGVTLMRDAEALASYLNYDCQVDGVHNPKIDRAQKDFQSHTEVFRGWDVGVILSSDASTLLSKRSRRDIGFFDFTRAIDVIYSRVTDAPTHFQRLTGVSPPTIRLSAIDLVQRPREFQDADKTFIFSKFLDAFSQLRPEDVTPFLHGMPNEELLCGFLSGWADTRVSTLEQRFRASPLAKNLSGPGLLEDLKAALRTGDQRMLDDYQRSLAEDSRNAIAHAFAADATGGLAVFLKTDTLRDEFNKADAEALYHLGRDLVLLNYPELRKTIERSARADSRITASYCR
jgi:predicted acylesterase/phospholipase RssA